ncbi:MAG TPA: chromosome segregation protein SMC [bacterium]|nr:chromosome segregation protein SMC [bacterium]
MYISQLDIFGFKSFARKTTLKFGPGVAGIVGPNGCGKTNVVDSIRWVLGEQKTTVLRSDHMQEVIYNGSKSMKPLGMCEVSLTIHNNKGILPVEFNDVVVTRRLYRDGQSEYLLNKQVCRLKDIQNLFIDTGMGADAYSVIELKMVENILSDTKDERARMFEEAAGINKYKQERRAARRKLDATKEDLLRINDILYEIEKNVSSLKRQMRKYERYQRYKTELQEKEVQLAAHKLWHLENDLIPLQEQLSQGKDIQSSSAEQLEIDEAIQASLKDQIREQERVVAEIETELKSIDDQRQDSRRNILVWREQQHAGENTLQRLEQESAHLQDRRQHGEEQVAELQSDLHKLQPELEAVHQRYQEQQERYQQVDRRYQEVRDQVNSYQQQKIDSITELADLRNKRDRLLENRTNAEQEIEALRRNMEEMGAAIQEKTQELARLEDQQQEAEYQAQLRAEKVREIRNEQQEVQEQIESTREQLLKQESEEDVLRSKIEFYEELIENREGFSSAVQYLTGDHKPVEGILGTVSDIIQVSEKFQLAVENALGDQAEYLLARDRATARQAIQVVKEANRGRVSVIPVDTIENLAPAAYNPGDGFTKLTDHIEYDQQYRTVVHLLLGDVLVGEDLDQIAQNGAPGEAFRLVSYEGEVREHSGILRGGKSESEYSSRVGRKETLRKLEDRIQAVQQRQKATRSNLSEYQQRMRELEAVITTLENVEQEEAQSSKILSQNITRLEYDISRSKQQKIDSDNKINALQEQIKEIDQTLQTVEPALTELQNQRQQLQHQITTEEETLEKISEQRNTENDTLQDLRLEVASTENEQKTLQVRLSNAEETIQDIEERFESIKRERSEAQEMVDKRKQSLSLEQEKLEEFEEQYQQLRSRRDEQRSILQQKESRLDDVEERIREKHRERETQHDRLRTVERQINEFQSEKRSVMERIRDRYGLEVEPGQLEGDTTEEELAQEITSLRSRLDRMGPINLAVKEEYEEEQGRLDFLTEQRDDLLQAEEDLVETIDRIDHQARNQFEEVFTQIRENFHQSFQMFFPGGQADLVLEGESDPLEADIEIKANPGGKDLQSLRMLSAGEKTLTAIAILFAIYMYKPSPFCILDEVDAPLDDNNSQIFTRVLDEFSAETQFIIVTHNKITMEAANYMYGITMQDEGVSKVVSVNFE